MPPVSAYYCEAFHHLCCAGKICFCPSVRTVCDHRFGSKSGEPELRRFIRMWLVPAGTSSSGPFFCTAKTEKRHHLPTFPPKPGLQGEGGKSLGAGLADCCFELAVQPRTVQPAAECNRVVYLPRDTDTHHQEGTQHAAEAKWLSALFLRALADFFYYYYFPIPVLRYRGFAFRISRQQQQHRHHGGTGYKLQRATQEGARLAWASNKTQKTQTGASRARSVARKKEGRRRRVPLS